VSLLRAPGKSALKRVVLFAWQLAGKRQDKVVAVFAATPTACDAAVRHAHSGAAGLPIWLFTISAPPPEVAALCAHVSTRAHPAALLREAERLLWRYWVALSVGTWTGERGRWLLKLAPFVIPPFRAVLMNENGDFFPGSPNRILLHNRRRLLDIVRPALGLCRDRGRAYWLLLTVHLWRSGPVNRARDISRAVWSLLTYHIWRSGPCTRAKDVLAAHLLAAATAVLRWCRYPDRRLFHRWHGDEPLRIDPPPSAAFGVAVYPDAGPLWSSSRLESFALRSDARFLVWNEKGTADSIADLLPLFSDPRTFAVSRQTHFRAWHPGLLPTAPFRPLQPGEVSQVLAPMSHTIVVDRQKLLSLGIPGGSMARTAWMILFWKAAAAGWRSYSMAGTQPVRQQPDYPLQERAFIFRVLADSALRRLAPQSPGLTRGNIAFRPASCPALTRTHRLKVLLVSPFLPYPLSHGGAVRIYNLCRALRGRVDFSLVALHENQEVIHYAELQEIFQQIRVVDNDEAASAAPQLPAQVRQHNSRALRAAVEELAAEWNPDLLQIEYTHLAAFRDSVPGVPAILVEHDLTFSLYRQLLKNQPGDAAQREYEHWLAFERHWLRAYDAVWTVSENDRRAAVEEGSRPESTFAIANGVDVSRFVPQPAPKGVPEVLYVGSFRHLPNILGFEHLRRDVMPRIWNRFPEVRLRVVAGLRHEMYWRSLAPTGISQPLDPRIEIEGFIEDLRPVYARASAVAVPLEVSAGTNIKVLEALASGKAVITTPTGCAGLDLHSGQDALICPDWEEFARCICEVLSSPALRTYLETEGRRTAEQRFSWHASAEAAYRSYIELMAMAEQRHETVRA